jgi:hypothetical protein
MAGGDIEVIFKANDRDVAAGLDRLAVKAGGFSGEMAKANAKVKEQLTGFKNLGPAAGAAVGAAFGLATKAVMDYADKNDLVQGSLDSLKRASADVWTSIGRDISAGGVGGVVEFIKTIDGARQATVNWIAGLFNDDAEGVGKAMKETENLIKAEKERRAIKEESARIEADILATSGDALGAATIRARMDRDAALKRINDMGLTAGADKDGLMALVENKYNADVLKARQDEADRRAKAQNDANAKDKAEDDKVRAAREKADDEARARAAARERLDMELAAADLESKRANMKKDEVIRAEKELDLRRKIFEISENELLTADDKAGAIERLRAISEGETASLLKGAAPKIGTVSLDTGISASRTAFAAARGGAGMTIAQQTRDASLRTAKAVEKIASGGVVAVVG